MSLTLDEHSSNLHFQRYFVYLHFPLVHVLHFAFVCPLQTNRQTGGRKKKVKRG